MKAEQLEVNEFEVIQVKQLTKDRRGFKNKSKYNLKYSPRKSQLKSVETVEGEPIEWTVKRMVQNNEPIGNEAPMTFTERAEGVQAAFNVRTDRFEVAADAMDKVTKSKIVARQNKGKVIPLDDKKEGDVGEAKS